MAGDGTCEHTGTHRGVEVRGKPLSVRGRRRGVGSAVADQQLCDPHVPGVEAVLVHCVVRQVVQGAQVPVVAAEASLDVCRKPEMHNPTASDISPPRIRRTTAGDRRQEATWLLCRGCPPPWQPWQRRLWRTWRRMQTPSDGGPNVRATPPPARHARARSVKADVACRARSCERGSK